MRRAVIFVSLALSGLMITTFRQTTDLDGLASVLVVVGLTGITWLVFEWIASGVVIAFEAIERRRRQ
jgi:hypothetical protein